MANWILNSETGDPDGAELNGCQIVQTGTSEFKFTDPTGTTTLSSSTSSPPVFSDFEFAHHKWTVIVASPLVPGSSTSGSWNNDDKEGGDRGIQDGNWTAQAGTLEPKDKAASADAYPK